MDRLALHGGTPVLSPRPDPWDWPPRYPGMDDLVARYIRSGQPLSIRGRDGILAECEDELKRRFVRKHALLCSSGTAALHSAYFAIDVRPGDEIVCTTVTYHATATPAMHLGGQVILVDVEPDTGNISIPALEAAITPRTKAVATNAMWGHPVEQEAVRMICDRHGLAWIEDVSHAHLATYNGRPVGSFGDIACASLQGSKLISGGEGGVLLTDNDEYHDRAVLLGHNLTRSEKFVINPRYKPIGRTGFGLKFRCHVLAAVLIHDQLVRHADRWVAQRHDSLTRLSAELGKLPCLRPPVLRPTTTSMGAWYGYKPWIDWGKLGIPRERGVQALQAEGLEADIPGSPALHTLALLNDPGFPIGAFPKHDNRGGHYAGADEYLAGIVSLPTFTGPTDEPLMQAFIAGFNKVWSNLDRLRG